MGIRYKFACDSLLVKVTTCKGQDQMYCCSKQITTSRSCRAPLATVSSYNNKAQACSADRVYKQNQTNCGRNPHLSCCDMVDVGGPVCVFDGHADVVECFTKVARALAILSSFSLSFISTPPPTTCSTYMT